MKFNLKAVLSTFLLSLLLIPVINSGALNPNQILHSISAISQQTGDQPVQNVTFRLLAVEANLDKAVSRSAQHLIKNLKLFSNWQNGTVLGGFQYFTYIRLLSDINYLEIDSECQPYYVGHATRDNVINETANFLNQTLPEDDGTLSVRVFYFGGYSNKATDKGNTSYYMALDKPVFDWELNKMLHCDQYQKSTIIILDTSYSGGYVARLASPGRVILAACNPSETPVIGWFTGQENAFYPNGTSFGPLGIIGATEEADDFNSDGWFSADEIFRFAWQTVTYFATNQTDPKTNGSYSLHPWASYGVAGGAIPLVQYNQSKPYPGSGEACIPRSILPMSSRYDWKQFEYPMYRQSLSRTGLAPTVGPKTPSLLWVSSLNSSVVSSAVIADGMVFVGTMGGRFYALDMRTGKEVWSFVANSAVSSSPSVSDGIVFFGTEKPGKIYALDAYTGLLRWLYVIPSGERVHSSPAIVNGMVFIGCSDGYLRCFSEFEGELLWATYLGGGELSSPAIADNTVFITSPYVYAVDMLTGTLMWAYQTRWPLASSPAVADGLVFVGGENDDNVFALEQKTGKLIWSFPTSGWVTSPAVDSYRKLVIVGCRDARTYCLNERTGYLKWQYINAPNHLSAPTIGADQRAYIGSSDGNLYCMNEETGDEAWKISVDSPIMSSPSIIYEHIIVASQEGKIFCLGPSFPEHNIAVLNTTASRLKLRLGESLEINSTIKNGGNREERITLICAQNSSNIWMSPEFLEPTIIHSSNITLAIGGNFTYTCSWNTTEAHLGSYSLFIQAQLVPDETDTSDNTFTITAVMIMAPEDLNADGQVNIIDISAAARAYGSAPGTPNWNPDADLNHDNLINIVDLTLIAKQYGKNYA